MDPSRLISFRPFKLSDMDHFMTWASDDRVTRYLILNSMTSKNQGLEYLEKVAIPHPFHLSICLNDLSIGYVSITQESGINRCRARISLALAFEHWGQGIATMAVKYAVTRGFEEFKDLVRIEGIVEVDCEGSQRVLEKVGFRNEGLMRKYAFNKGEIRDVYVFSILSTDPISA
ncbi:unnamed protein product [Rhodiola kirilowii]